MAIEYKSVGNSDRDGGGNALTPSCPATVDAGDILIAYLYCRPAIASTPNAPAGWELLGGQEFQSQAEHWIFGKIADGTEDGTTPSFFSNTATTKAARIYSFSGYVNGTILQVVKTPVYTSQGAGGNWTCPTVTTTQTGALAVAFIGITDDNAVATPTGESGGDWTQPVGAYSDAGGTTDFSLGLFRAVPTGNPGTISGGTGATGGDYTGLIGVEIVPNGITSYTVALGQVSETHTATSFVAKKNKVLGQATENNTIQAFVSVKNKIISVVLENSAPQAFTSQKSNLIGQVNETDFAENITRFVVISNPVYYPHQVIRSIGSDLYFASLPSDTIIKSIGSDGVIE